MSTPQSPSRPASPARRLRPLGQALPTVVAFGLALLVRYLVVEPAWIAHACDPAPWSGWCAARSALIRSFSTQALGWLSLSAGVAALLAWRLARAAEATGLKASAPAPAVRQAVDRATDALAQVALAAGAAGLVLYCFEPSAVGALLGALALNRDAAGRGR